MTPETPSLDDHPEYVHEAFYASRHPIRRFLGALLVVALALLAVWWAGPIAPRLSTGAGAVEVDRSSGLGAVELEIRNDAPTPIRILDVGVDAASEITSATVDGRPVDTHPSVGGGTTTVLRVTFRAGGCAGARAAQALTIDVRARTSSGATRTEWLSVPFPSDAPC